MTVSAPFIKKMILAVGTCCRMIPILLLVLVKGKICRILNL